MCGGVERGTIFKQNNTMIFLGADHRGYALKEQIKKILAEWGREFEDLGVAEPNMDDDYPDITRQVISGMQEGDRAVLICGSGVGVSIVANRVKGIRCAVGISAAQVRTGRTDDDINALALASDFVNEEDAREMITAFLEAPFSGQERFVRRIGKIDRT